MSKKIINESGIINNFDKTQHVLINVYSIISDVPKILQYLVSTEDNNSQKTELNGADPLSKVDRTDKNHLIHFSSRSPP